MAVSLPTTTITIPMGAEMRSITLSGSEKNLSQDNVANSTKRVAELVKQYQTLLEEFSQHIPTFVQGFNNALTTTKRFFINNKANIEHCFLLLNKIGIKKLDATVAESILEIKEQQTPAPQSTATPLPIDAGLTAEERLDLKYSLKGYAKSTENLAEHLKDLMQPFNDAIFGVGLEGGSLVMSYDNFKNSTGLSIINPDLNNITQYMQTLLNYAKKFSTHLSALMIDFESADTMIQAITVLCDKTTLVLNQFDQTKDLSLIKVGLIWTMFRPHASTNCVEKCL